MPLGGSQFDICCKRSAPIPLEENNSKKEKEGEEMQPLCTTGAVASTCVKQRLDLLSLSVLSP